MAPIPTSRRPRYEKTRPLRGDRVGDFKPSLRGWARQTTQTNMISHRTHLPLGWASEVPRGIGQLVCGEVLLAQLPPPMTSFSISRFALQSPCEPASGRVHNPNRHVVTNQLQGQTEVGVVRDHHRRVDVAAQHIHEQVRCDVDITALLFPHQGGSQHDVATVSIVHSTQGKLGRWERRLGANKLRTSLSGLIGKRNLLCPSHVLSELDVIHGSDRVQCLQVHVLIGVRIRRVRGIYPGRAVDNALDSRPSPVRTLSDEGRRERMWRQPFPTRRSPAEPTTARVVQVIAVNIDTDSHKVTVASPAVRTGTNRSQLAAPVVPSLTPSPTGQLTPVPPKPQ